MFLFLVPFLIKLQLLDEYFEVHMMTWILLVSVDLNYIGQFVFLRSSIEDCIYVSV
jgi:hypothetical protein